MTAIRKSFFIVTALLLSTFGLQADEVAMAGRAIYNKNQEAVITIKVVIKVSGSSAGMSINQQEQRIETTGTIIDPSGLSVTSYTLINPASAIRSNIKRMLAARGMATSDVDINSEVMSAKFILSDGTEMNAEVILRDEDLDVAFLRPIDKPDKPLPCVSLTDNPTVELFDPVVLLNRLGNIAKRTLAVSLGRIDSRIQKPRLLYSVSATSTSHSIGGPAFTLEGKLIGFSLIRKTQSEDDTVTGFGGNQSGLMPALIPANELSDSIKQALSTTLKKAENK